MGAQVQLRLSNDMISEEEKAKQLDSEIRTDTSSVLYHL